MTSCRNDSELVGIVADLMKSTRSTLMAVLILLVSACGSRPATRAPEPEPPPTSATQHGVTPAEEAAILRLEDRREFNEHLAETWTWHPDEHHRARIALALARIGEATFVDANGNGVHDDGEKQAGVEQLLLLTVDPHASVRRNVAFALGEIGDPAGLEALFTLAHDHDGLIASEAVEAISKLDSAATFERYAELTSKGRPPAVRATAIRFLFRFLTDAALPLAVDALDDPSPEIRREAAYALSRKPSPSARERLESLAATSGDAETRAYAVRALARIGDRASLDALFSALGDPHPWVRTNAARAIAQLAREDPAAIERSELERDAGRIALAIGDPDPGTAAAAIETLASYAPVDAAAKARLLEVATESRTPWYRQLAVAGIARVFGESEPGTLRPLLDSPDRWVKIEALGATSDQAVTGPQLRARFFDDADPAVRAAAIGAIPDGAVAAETALIERALADPDVIVRASAIDRFAAIPSSDAAQKLDVLLAAEFRARTDSMNDARLSAIRAISAIESDRRESFLSTLVADDDPVVRRTSADLIESALHRPRPQYTPLPIDRSIEDYLDVARWASQHHTATIHSATGDIVMVLLTDAAPLTARNFADLASRGYFNGTSFMRVVPNFVIQGGDPRNDMSGGPGYAIRDEMNLEKYTRAAVGMALSGPDTGGSQFFITHSPQPHLDGGYTIFGRVIDGLTHSVDIMNRGDRVQTITIDEAPWKDGLDVMKGAVIPLPLVIGALTRERIVQMIPEYRQRTEAYEPDRVVVEAIAGSVEPGDRIEVVLGTWCTDSRREVPKLLKIVDLLHSDFGVDVPVVFTGVDRSKREPAKAIEGFAIEKVATFIVERAGVEIGRIVESPDGLFEDDLFAILARRQ